MHLCISLLCPSQQILFVSGPSWRGSSAIGTPLEFWCAVYTRFCSPPYAAAVGSGRTCSKTESLLCKWLRFHCRMMVSIPPSLCSGFFFSFFHCLLSIASLSCVCLVVRFVPRYFWFSSDTWRLFVQLSCSFAVRLSFLILFSSDAIAIYYRWFKVGIFSIARSLLLCHGE